MSFGPIAIVGRDVLFPGAGSAEQLGDVVFEQRSTISDVPPDRWRVDPARVSSPGKGAPDRTRSLRGGYVRDFEPRPGPDFDLPRGLLEQLDPSFRWALELAAGAWADVGGPSRAAPAGRKAVVMGLLSFPNEKLASFAEEVWGTAEEGTHPLNRFMSGLPSQLIAQALGCEGPAFALDAACASSLYAIKLASDLLHDDRADYVLAGAVNRADDLFIHIGFTALDALSPTGHSRPFHAGADGLVPAEGAGFVALTRYEDAVAQRLPIHGVIRGVGLANDGRGRGLLAPSARGQIRSMELALASSGLRPEDVSFAECHATGTPVGDATELESMAQVYGGQRVFPVGSVKSNFGHPITAAGVAGLTKILESFRRGALPPTQIVDVPNPALAQGNFRVLQTPEPFAGPRRACLSAFGFGGNDAHLIVEAPEETASAPASRPAPRRSVAVLGLGLQAGPRESAPEVLEALATPGPTEMEAKAVEMSLSGLRFPPKDLQSSLPQQKAIISALQECMSRVELEWEGSNTGVYVGMGCDPEVARWGARWRLPENDPRRDALAPPLTAAAVVGTMPNMPANRLSSLLDLKGPSFTVSSEESSGLVALELAARALAAGEIDRAIVASADFSSEPVHAEALARLGVRTQPGDGATVLVLVRPKDVPDGVSTWAILDLDSRTDAETSSPLAARFGRPHAAATLMDVAAHTLELATHRRGRGPDLARAPRAVRAQPAIAAAAGGKGYTPKVLVRAADVIRPPGRGRRLHVYEGPDYAALAARARREDGASRIDPTHQGPRLVLAAPAGAPRAALAARLEGNAPTPGAAYFERPLGGSHAAVYTAAGAAHGAMGRALLTAYPELGSRLSDRFSGWREALQRSWTSKRKVLDSLWGSTALTQVHVELAALVGFHPESAWGYSSGATNALFAHGLWTGLDDFIAEAEASPLFRTELAGEFRAVARAWSKTHTEGLSWSAWTVEAPLAAVEAAVETEPQVHLAVIHTGNESVIAGEARAAGRVVARLGAARTRPLDYPLAVHVPEVETIRDQWWALHARPVTPQSIRLYGQGHDGPLELSREACAASLTAQACAAIDLRPAIEAAYADGVRVFVEHGPNGACSRFIGEILGERPHLAVPLDDLRDPVGAAWHAWAQVAAAGVDLDLQPLVDLDAAWPAPRRAPLISHPAHLPRMADLPALPSGEPPMPKNDSSPASHQSMAAAPKLPSSSTPHASGRRWPDGRVETTPTPLPKGSTPFTPPFVSATTRSPTGPGPDTPAGLLIAHREALETAHREHISAQSALQEQFLEVQNEAFRTLSQAWSSEDLPNESLPSAPAPASRIETAPDFVAPVRPAPQRPAPDVVARTPAPPQRAIAPKPSLPKTPVVAKPTPPAAPPAAKKTAPRAVPSAKAKAFKPNMRPTPSPTPQRRTPIGPTFDFEALKVHASGPISEIFGPEFGVQDTHPRQVRMPEPPLLLAHRVTGLDADKGSMTTGVIWTETDIAEDSWYLHDGHMPAGVMIESGQADLMLISWLGCDFENRGERIYRLLGCDLTYHGGLPKPGDRLEYEIHIDGHAEQGPVRIFFFHYDGWIADERRISVRGGQAGFFTDEELANSGGILWDPAVEPPETDGRQDPPRIAAEAIKTAFTEADVEAFASGDAASCFGPEYARLATHTRTPRISGGEMVFFDTVQALDPKGGPWGRGYMRAHRRIRPDDWFFRGHFKNDPCMPGTLMFEGCLQTMAFYLAGLGMTLDKDGWRFEPVPEETYRLRCRGQVTPTSRDLIYEVFVEQVWDGDEPRLIADLMCTVDGLKAFHAQRMQLRLIPDWPLDAVGKVELARQPFPGARPAVEAGGVHLGLDAMLACAWGKPTRAFGSMYERFDGARKVPRLPGPPYHFMSRVVSAPPEMMGAFEPSVDVEVEYDVPPDAWYFQDSATGKMPFAVLLEAALQPCGWLASYIGSTLQVEEDLFFRNLDGTGTVHAELGPDAGILRTSVRLERVSKTGAMIIVGFTVKCSTDAGPVYDMDTVFGFFPAEALASQAGLPTKQSHRELLLREGGGPKDLASSFDGLAPLSRNRLALLDELTGWWPEGGEAGLGEVRTRMKVEPSQWFFAAHFFQDPVQPGSLGIEAMLDALRVAALLRAGDEAKGRRFEVLAAGTPLAWKYRGQVMPENDQVEVTLELTDDVVEDGGRRFVAQGSLWVDGKRIYEAKGLAVRLVDGPSEGGDLVTKPKDHHAPEPQALFQFDADGDEAWLKDHRPTWTVPAVPMMVLADRLAQLAGGPPVRLENVRLRGWVLVDRPRTLSGRKEGDHVALLDESGAVVIEARVGSGTAAPEPLPPTDGETREVPYSSGGLFHGPAFQVMTTWLIGAEGATAVLDRDAASDPCVPSGAIDPLLLDGGTHAIPHDRLDLWCSDISADKVAYPARIDSLEVFSAPPSRETRVEARFDGLAAGADFPRFRLQWISGGQVWAEVHLVEAAFPKGPLGTAPAEHRKAFLSGQYVPGVSLSAMDGDRTRLDPALVSNSDWLPGTVDAVYGTTNPRDIAVAEHRSRRHALHPHDLDRKLPLTSDPVEVQEIHGQWQVDSSGPSQLDLSPVSDFWKGWFQREGWPVEDLYFGLIERFVRRVVLTDPEGFEQLRGKSVLFLGNHQTMVESLLFSIVASAFIERPTVTIAKIEHEHSWLGTLIRHCFAYPGVADPGVITFFDRDDKESLPGIIMGLGAKLAANEKGVMVHVEGTRAKQAVHHVERMSGAFLDLAIQTGAAVVPVRFVGGLSVEPIETRTDFPVGMGKQDIWFGAPFTAEKLKTLPYGPRKQAVLQALDALGGPRDAERALESHPEFEARVAERVGNGTDEADAVILEVLLDLEAPRSPGIRALTEAARSGTPLAVDDTPEGAWLAALARRLGVPVR